LKLTDGTTTLDFINNAAYALEYNAWAPNVSSLKSNYLAGSDEYEDVVEEIPLTVRGATGSAALANLEAIARLLVQAERWRRGENVAAVRMQFQPCSSTMPSPLEAIVLGNAPGERILYVPPSITDYQNYEIYGVKVKLLRRGRWLANSEVNVTTAAYSNGELATISIGNALQLPSPTRLVIQDVGYGKSSGGRFRSSLFLLAELSTDIIIVNAETMAGGVWTSVADTGASARASNVLRYTPAGTGVSSSGTSGALTLTSATDLVAVYANVRNSTTISFRIRIRLDSNVVNASYTPWVYIPAAASQYPRWIFCGLVSKKQSIQNMYIEAVASAAASYLDIDTLVLADARTVKIFGIEGPGDAEPNLYSSPYTLYVDHNLLSYPSPTALLENLAPVPHQGDIILNTKAATLYGLHLGTGDTNGGGIRWRQYNNSYSIIISNVWTVYRRASYITPQ